MPPACYTRICVTARLGWGAQKALFNGYQGIPILQCISVVSLSHKGTSSYTYSKTKGTSSYTYSKTKGTSSYTYSKTNRQDIQTDRAKYPQMMPYLYKDKVREVLTGLTGSSNNHDYKMGCHLRYVSNITQF